jgi:anti-sigma factor RsiW
MRCSESSEMMSLAVDGILSAHELRAMETHLSSCPTCLRQWQALQALSSLFADQALAEPTDGFAERVVLRMARRDVRRQRTRGAVGVLAGSATLWSGMLAILLVWFALAWRPLLEAVWNSLIQPCAWAFWNAGGAFVGALTAVLNAVFQRPTALFMSAYVLLALLAVGLWIYVMWGPGASLMLPDRARLGRR